MVNYSPRTNYFKSVIETNPDGFVIVDHTRRLIDVNSAYCRMSGYSREEILQLSIEDIDAVESSEEISERIKRVMVEGRINFESIHRRKDGSSYEVEISLGINPDNNRLIAFCRDITERKKAEKTALERERIYRILFHRTPIGLIYFDKEGRVTDCNELAIKIIGSSAEAIIGINMLNLQDPDVISAVRSVLSGKGSIYDGNYHSITAEKITPLHAIFEPIFDDSGNISGGIVIIEDITEKKITERALVNELEKERARIGRVLHDSLGQKLGAVLYLVQAFSRKYHKTDKLSDDDIEKLSEIAYSALEEIRSLSRGLDFPMEMRGLIELLNEIVRNVAGVYGIDVELNVNDSILRYDSMKLMNLYYIILEAINNAIRHGKATRIKLHYFSRDGEGFFYITSYQNNVYKMEKPGMGLRIMKYRADVSGMKLKIFPNDEGVSVTVSMGKVTEFQQ